MKSTSAFIPVPVDGKNIPDGKIEFYGALHDYKKEVDALSIPPLLENYMLGFFNWLFKRLEKKEGYFLSKDELEKVFNAARTIDGESKDYGYDYADFNDWLNQQSTLKTVLPKRTCTDCGTTFYSNERCPECNPLG